MALRAGSKIRMLRCSNEPYARRQNWPSSFFLGTISVPFLVIGNDMRRRGTLSMTQ